MDRPEVRTAAAGTRSVPSLEERLADLLVRFGLDAGDAAAAAREALDRAPRLRAAAALTDPAPETEMGEPMENAHPESPDDPRLDRLADAAEAALSGSPDDEVLRSFGSGEAEADLPLLLGILRDLEPAGTEELPAGWRALGELGAGGQGRVLLVVREETGERAAFKRIRTGDRDPHREPIAFDRLREVRSPALVRLLGIHPSGILMEHLDGEPLSRFVRPADRPGPAPLLLLAQRLGCPDDPWRGAARAFAGLARGIDALHREGLVHRDLKPENVMAVPGRGLVFIDLGLARVRGMPTLTGTDTLVGTAPFLAPEALPGSGLPVDARTDVYGLGATLYSLLTNRWPYEGADVLAILDGVRRGRPQPVRAFSPGAPAALSAIVEMAMARDPGRRYPSAAAFAEDLERFARGQPALADTGASGRRARRRRRLALVGLLALALAAGFLVHRGARERAEQDLARTAARDAREALEGLCPARALEAIARAVAELRDPGLVRPLLLLRATAHRQMGDPERSLDAAFDAAAISTSPGDREEARRSVTDTLAADGNFDGVCRFLLESPDPLSAGERAVLADALLREGRSGSAQALLAESGDARAVALLERHARIVRVPLPMVHSLAATLARDSRPALFAAVSTGRLFRIRLDGPPRAEPVDSPDPLLARPVLAGVGTTTNLAAYGKGALDAPVLRIFDPFSGALLRELSPARHLTAYHEIRCRSAGEPQPVLCFFGEGRGIRLPSLPDWSGSLPLGDLEEVDRAATDVRDVLEIPEADPPLLLVATGPWDLGGQGYSIHVFERVPDGAFRRRSPPLFVGEVSDLERADLDGDGLPEIYAAVRLVPDRSHYADFRRFGAPGLYRLDGVETDRPVLTPVLTLPRTAFLTPEGDIAAVAPEWEVVRLAPARGPDGTSALVLIRVLKESRRGGVRKWADLVVAEASGRYRALPLAGSASGAESLVVADLDPAPGDEIAILGEEEVIVIGAGPAPIAAPPSPPTPSGPSARGEPMRVLAELFDNLGYHRTAAGLWLRTADGAAGAPARVEALTRRFDSLLAADDVESARETAGWIASVGTETRGGLERLDARLAEAAHDYDEALRQYREALAAGGLGTEAGAFARTRAAALEDLLRRPLLSVRGSGAEILAAPFVLAEPRMAALEGDGSVRLLLYRPRLDEVVVPVQGEVRSARLEARLRIRSLDYGAGVALGIFDEEPDAPSPATVWGGVYRTSHAPRDLRLVSRDGSADVTGVSLLPAGSYRVRCDHELRLLLDYRADTLTARFAVRDETTGESFLPRTLTLTRPLPAGRLVMGITAGDRQADMPIRSELSVLYLSVEVRGDVTFRPGVDSRSSPPPPGPVVLAQSRLLAGDADGARAALRPLLTEPERLADALAGPFAEPSLPLARLALDLLPPAAAGDLREALVARAARRKWSIADPDLLLGLLDPTDAAALDLRRAALFQLGRLAEVADLGPIPVPSRPPHGASLAARIERADERSRLGRPGEALALLGEIEDPGSYRARFEIAAAAARAHVALRRPDLALAALRRLAGQTGFDPEPLRDDPALRPLLRELPETPK